MRVTTFCVELRAAARRRPVGAPPGPCGRRPTYVQRGAVFAVLLGLAVLIASVLRSPTQRALWPLEVRAAARYRLPPALVAAVVEVESGGNRFAVSSRGALGLMQVTRDKFKRGQDPFSAETNLDVGSRYLAEQLNTFHGDLSLALAAYNAGPAAVRRYHGIPPYPETIHYVRAVQALYGRWRSRTY